MWEQIFSITGKEGVFALLFVALFIYTMKNNEKRESLYIEREVKYQNLVERLTNIIKGDICDIKEVLEKLSKDND